MKNQNRVFALVTFFAYFYIIVGSWLFHNEFEQFIINRTSDWNLILFAIIMTTIICGTAFIVDKLIDIIKNKRSHHG